jgi:DNA (cytosine-5)-methyltransferase 1
MGFPDDFIFKGSKVEIARQIGNAVPPQFAGALSQVVKEALATRKKTKPALRRKKPAKNVRRRAPIGETVAA